MGYPPQIELTRKLIRSHFKRHDTMKSTAAVQNKVDQVMKCWHKHGFLSELCADVVEQFNQAINEQKKPELKIEGMKLSQFVMNELNTPIYPKHMKGRHKDWYTDLLPRKDSIYDGIAMKKEVK